MSKPQSDKNSDFIQENEQIAIIKQTQAIKESAGIWTDENHPEMKDEKAIDQWLKDLRQDRLEPSC